MHSWLTRCSIGLTTLAVTGATLLIPAPAQAAGTDIEVSRPASSAAPAATTEATTTAPVSREVEVEQTPVKAAPQAGDDAASKRTAVDPFRMAGVTWDAGSGAADVSVRVQVRTNGAWSHWQALSIEDSNEGGRPGTAPLWTEAPADGIAVEVKSGSGTPTGIKVTTIDPGKPEVVTPVSPAVFNTSEGEPDEGLTEEIAADGTPKVVPMPSIITRAQWKAGAGTSCSAPVTRPKALGVTIHHTAGSNTYTKAESAGLVRSYQTYHVKGHGWCDIGYSFLVDRFGQIFEGRKGGITKQVRGAHSGVEAVNQYATGISMMGHFDYVQPSAALKTAVVKLVGWRVKYFGANAKGTFSAGGKRYQVIHGHRDVKSTACPGKYGYAWLGAVGGLRDRAAAYVSKATSAAGAPAPAPAPKPVTLNPPTGVKVTASSTSATVTWNKVKGASGYRVMASPTGSSAGAKYVNVTSNRATISGLHARRTYAFRVSVYQPSTKKRVSAYTSKPFATARTTAFTAPTGVRVTVRTKTGLRFLWNRSAGAPGYKVQVTELGKKPRNRYYVASVHGITVRKLKKDTQYRVRVSVAYPDSKERVSAYSRAPHVVGRTLKSTPKAVAPKPAPQPAPKPVSAKNVVTPSAGKVIFKGHGYGHGIGMSQYGAEGGARAGQKYDAILRKYYPGTKLSSKSASIRVQISADTTNSVSVKPRSGLKFRTLSNGAVITLPSSVSKRKVATWSIEPAKSDKKKNSLFYQSGSTWYTYSTFAGDAQFEGPPTISLVMPSGSTRAYRGALRSTRPTATSRDTVNVLGLEDYLRGVVAREMPSSWSMEALKAQSVAARTFGARYLGSSKHYDICDTVSCQVYGGYADETQRTNDAINGTKGKILTYQGAPALTQFSSSSGGHTNQGSTPYLKPVSDPWDAWSGNKNHAWTQTVTTAAIQKKYAVGTLKSISITKRNGLGDQGGRVVSMTLKGSKGSRTITGVDARWAFGLKSDWFGF